MKKKLISLLICVCLCVTLLPAVCLTASAGVGFTVRVNGTVCGLGTTTLPNGEVTVDCTGSNVTITLDNCKVGSSWECYDGANKYNCGLLFLGDANEPADVNLVLKGSNEIIPSVLILNAASLTVTSIDDGNLTVHTSFTTHCPVLLDKTDLTVTGEQSMMDAAFYCSELTVDRPEVKGGGSLSQTMLTIDTKRYIGLSCTNLTINGGITNISAQNLGLLMISGSEDAPQLQVDGGITDIHGDVAAVYICGHYGNMSNVRLGNRIGDAGGNVLSSTENDGGFCKQSWIASDEEYPLYFCDADGNNDFWYDHDLMSNAAKSICLKEITYAYASFDCGDFGTVAGEQKWILGFVYDTSIGVLPIPVNTTFAEGKFNGMYFEGWELKNKPGEIIDETFVIDRNIELQAVWREGQSGMSFTDVKPSQWFYDAVNYCYGQKLIAGTSATTFGPQVNCSRAMIVTILYRMEGEPVAFAGNPFSDVKEGQWYTDAVLWASENGIVSGDGKGHFMPDTEVTREQLASIMMRYADYSAMYKEDDCITTAGFPDAGKTSSWAHNAMSWAFGFGILSGKGQKDGTNLLDPGGVATRAEFAAILLNYMRRTQNTTTFYGNVLEAPVPAMWQGNVMCHKTIYNNTCILTFYCKPEYEATKGLGGRLFAIVTTDSNEYLDDPNFDSYLCSVNNINGEKVFNVYRQRNTDVQCDQTVDTQRGARFYSMLLEVKNLGFNLSSIDGYYTVSYGVG
ncbi:MAG: S-layer homology domain-containing protein [Clostridia bacterium]|nr:S-layer homology domain-containing protein [Clostridia bacterium]